MNRHILRLAAALAAAAATAGLSACGSSDVTKSRLERSLPQTFSNLYVQQAKLLGHKGLTVQSLHARAQCDKGGPKVADHGPGADWICLMAFHDPYVPLPDGTAKFEMNVHSNNCYTAGGPSKIVGLLTITDTHGHDVPNPVFEFDGCFDPNGSNAPSGAPLPAASATSTTSAAPAPTPAALTLPTGRLVVDGRGRIAPKLTCSTGDGGCAGTLTAQLGNRSLRGVTFALAPGKTGTVPLRVPAASGGKLVLAVKPVIGTVPDNSSVVTVAAR